MSWHARLKLDYRREGDRSVLHFVHDGPLRVLQSLYPEGPAVCHNVLVHPPGGLVAGDELDVAIRLGPDAHALLSTPGATRFYRCRSGEATQRVAIQLEAGARLEWFPLETLAYPGCRGHNLLHFFIAPGAALMGWDIIALGLSDASWDSEPGTMHLRLHWSGHWLEHARIDAADARLLHSPLGLAGQRCLGSFWLAWGGPSPPSGTTPSDTTPSSTPPEASAPTVEAGGAIPAAWLEAVRQTLPAPESGAPWLAATCPHPRLLLVRGLAAHAEPLRRAFEAAWAVLRPLAWGLEAHRPRIWDV